MTTVKIGLFGFGSVGQGFYKQALQNNSLDIQKIVVKTRDKARILDAHYFSYDKNEILNDPAIDVIVEAIDDHEQSFEIVSTALRNKKHVVTANKKMLASHLAELLELQKENNVTLLYEASSLGSIPAIKNVEEYFGDEQINSFSGIFNGTSNFILTKIFNENIDYGTALKQAQDLGFAEADPTNDVEGFDARSKLIILSLHAYGIILKPEQILTVGVNNLKDLDIDFAIKHNHKIKLVPRVIHTTHGIHAFVLPQFVSSDDLIFHIENEHNILVIDGQFTGKQTYTGKGAGSEPTGSAVYKDVLNVLRKHNYQYSKFNRNADTLLSDDLLVEVYLRTNGPHAHISFESIKESGFFQSDYFTLGYVNLKTLLDHSHDLLAQQAVIIATGATKAVDQVTELAAIEETLLSV
jgi:homoserine dehydrogenase